MEPLVWTVEERGNATVVHLQGEVDSVTAADLRDVLIQVLSTKPSTHLILDLSGVDFLDSTGIGVIVAAHKRVTAHGGWFTAVVTTPTVRKVLRVTGLLRAWRVTSSVEDALDDV